MYIAVEWECSAPPIEHTGGGAGVFNLVSIKMKPHPLCVCVWKMELLSPSPALDSYLSSLLSFGTSFILVHPEYLTEKKPWIKREEGFKGKKRGQYTRSRVSTCS